MIAAIKINHSSFVQTKTDYLHHMLQMKHPQTAQFLKDWVRIYLLTTPKPI